MSTSKSPRFRLSTVLWLSTIFAVVLGWYVDRQRLATRLEELEEKPAQLTLLAPFVTTNVTREEIRKAIAEAAKKAQAAERAPN